MRIEDLLETNQLIARQQNMKLYVACFALYGASGLLVTALRVIRVVLLDTSSVIADRTNRNESANRSL